MFNLRSYVVGRDFRSWGRDLVERFRGELLQWRKADELSCTALMIAALLSIFRGMRGGLEGAAIQMHAEQWAELLGVSSRMVLKAFAQLEAHGWARRRRRLIKHEWNEGPKHHQRADVHACAYLLPLGAVRILRRGQRAGELVRRLSAEHTGEIRVIAKRITDAPTRFRPFPVGKKDASKEPLSSAREGARPIFRSATDPPAPSGGPSPPGAVASGRYGYGRFAAELERLAALRALTPSQAWPDLWFGGDDVQRRWLSREWASFEPELKRQFARWEPAGPELEQLQALLRSDAERWEAADFGPSQRDRAVRLHLYAEQWSSSRRAWVPAPGRYMMLGDLRKRQAALRAVGELPRKKRRQAANVAPV